MMRKFQYHWEFYCFFWAFPVVFFLHHTTYYFIFNSSVVCFVVSALRKKCKFILMKTIRHRQIKSVREMFTWNPHVEYVEHSPNMQRILFFSHGKNVEMRNFCGQLEPEMQKKYFCKHIFGVDLQELGKNGTGQMRQF